MPNRIPPDIWSFLTVLIVSATSGVVSIIHRISRGHTCSFLWVLGEFLAAIHTGYLASETYPALDGTLPRFVQLPLFVSVCAYSGGRLMQVAEEILYSRLPGDHK